VCEGGVGFGDGEAEFLQAAGDADGPGAVAEVAFDFADDGGDGVAGEVDAAVGVEFVDGFDEADGGGLDEIVGGFAAAGVSVGEVAGQGQPGLDRAGRSILQTVAIIRIIPENQ